MADAPVVARVGGLGVERRWDNILSLGEQKMVGFARVLLAAPTFVFLERPRTGLGPEQLDRVMDQLARNAISPLTIGKPEDALRYYNSVLELKNDGGWQWNPIRPAA